MAKITEEMKRFISTKHMEEEKGTADILKEFGDAFGFLPSASTISKYQLFNETNPPKEEEPEDDDDNDIDGKEGKVTVKEKDTRLEKDLVEIEGLDTDSAEFERICRTLEKSKKETFDLLQMALRKGYTKIDISTGDVEK